MLLRAARLVLTAAFVFSVFTEASPAQLVPAVTTTRPRVPQTPYERYVRPVLNRLAAGAQTRTSQSLAAPAANTASAAAPNFGGFVGPASYPARAANSAQYDPFNNGVNAVVTADFNKDGFPDLAVIQSDGTLNILQNTGSGAMAASVGYLNPSPNVQNTFVAQAFATDLNGDGYPDLVAFDSNNSVVLAWLNNGSGVFGQPQLTQLDPSLGNVAAIAVGDVNGDGKADVVVGYWSSNSPTASVLTLQTLQGNGDGTYKALTAQNFSFSSSVDLQGSSPLTLADVNGDGKLDVIALIDNRTGQFAGNYSVSTALGNGDGTFGAPGPSVISGSYLGFVYASSSVQVLDVNNDGKPDIVLDCNNLIYTALGNGDNSFQPPVTSPFLSSGSTVFADMNGDGFPDAVTPGANGVSISLGKGDGTFAAPALNAQYAANASSQQGAQLAVADFTGNHKLGVAVLDVSQFEVSVFNGNGDGTLQGPLVLSAPVDFNPEDYQLVGALNANGDAYTDLVLADGAASAFLYTALSDGKGNFKYVQSLAGLPADLAGVETFQGDFNGDGKQDLILNGLAGEVWVALSKGDGTFAAPVSANMPTLACPVALGAAGDLNADGKTDMVIAYPGDAACNGGSTNPSGYFVLKGNGDGTFQTPIFYPVGEDIVSATLADMNSDGNLDLLLNDLPPYGNTGYQVSLELGNGDGTFGAPSTVLSDYVVADVKVADMNQDGKLDVVVAAESLAGSDVSTAGILVIDGNGDGTFGAHSQTAIGNNFGSILVADVNGDGIPDIEALLNNYAGQDTTYGGFVTLLGVGGGGFSAPSNQLVAPGNSLIVTGNFYDDNAIDMAVGTNGGVGIFLAQGGTTLALTASSAAINVGSSETLTATVAATMSGRPTPTGSVSFYDGSTLLGTTAVSGGSAAFSISSLAVGAHSITAFYTGDANFNQNTASAVATVTVNTLAPAFTIAGAPGTLTLKQGANGTVVLTLAANATFSGPVTLSCSGAPTNGTCSFDNSNITLTAGGSATATLVVGTTGTVAAGQLPANPWEHAAGMVSMAGLAAFFWSRRRRLRYMSAFGVALLAVALFGISGCGGGGARTTAPVTPTAPVVSTGTYTLTVTASATGSAAPAQTATVAVTVQ
jgi:hypothetical protein